MSDKEDIEKTGSLRDFVVEFAMEHDLTNITDKSDPEFQKLLKLAADKWQLELSVLREASSEDLLYLLEHCPFLQIIERGEKAEGFAAVEKVEAASGWVMHDYGDAICCSPGRFIIGGGYFRISLEDEEDEDEEGGEGGGVVNPGKGTIYKQAFDTAFEMVKLANVHGWEGITIVDGHPLMLRAAWIASTAVEGLVIAGFHPTDYDQKVRERFMMSQDDTQSLIQKNRAQQKEDALASGTQQPRIKKSSTDKKPSADQQKKKGS